MKQDYLTLRDAAAAIGVKPYRIVYAITMGLVTEPALRVANRRVFQPKDIVRLQQHFENGKIRGDV